MSADFQDTLWPQQSYRYLILLYLPQNVLGPSVDFFNPEPEPVRLTDTRERIPFPGPLESGGSGSYVLSSEMCTEEPGVTSMLKHQRAGVSSP